jgi:HEAT repeat protein
MLDEAFEALKTYHWGHDRNTVKPIDDAVIATRGDAAARKELEARLAAVLTTSAPYDARQYVCRKLRLIGTAACVPTLAGLLTDKELSHMARFALERIPAPEAGQAIRDALAKVGGELKIGMIASIGVRGEAAGIALLAALLGDKDVAVAKAAAHALGAMASPEASEALAGAKPTDAMKATVADASLACAEKLLAAGNRAAALRAYERLLAGSPAEAVREAAKRGKAACTGG